MNAFCIGILVGWVACWAYFFVFRLEQTKAKVRRKLELMAECVVPSDVLKEIVERKP